MAGISGSSLYKRTLDDTRTVIAHAKLEECELKPITQVLYFRDEDTNNEYKFVELDHALLNELHEGQSLCFRGEKEEMAVLCTADTTYDVKEAQTSNSMLLLSDLKFSDDISSDNGDRILEDRRVIGVFHNYLELQRCKPRLSKLLSILNPSRYQGREFEADLLSSDSVKFFTYPNLVEVIQASQVELHGAIEEFLVCSIGGYCRVLDEQFKFKVISSILQLVDGNSWPLDGLVKSETITFLCELFDVEILEAVFDWFTVQNKGLETFKLNERRVCSFLGKMLLTTGKKLLLSEFMFIWQTGVPEGMVPQIKYMDGIGLIQRKKGTEDMIQYFPESDLPEDINERMCVLFKFKEKWSLDEIRPFIQRLATNEMNVNAMLTKYSRASSVDGVKYYSAKHAK